MNRSDCALSVELRSLIVALRVLALCLGPYRCRPSVSRLVGQPLPDDAFQRAIGALHVIYAEADAVAIAEVEFRRDSGANASLGSAGKRPSSRA